METPSLTTAIATVGELFSQSEELALSGFLAGYSGLTREAYALDLRQYANGLRVSEAIGANIEQLGLERGHRTLTFLRKGSKTVTIPLAPRTARAIDLAVGERSEGPIFTSCGGHRLDRQSRGAGGAARGEAVRDHEASESPHPAPRLHHCCFGRGRAVRDVQEAASHADPRTTMRYDRARVSLDRHATYIVATFIAGAAR
jgi:integrase/recombinase XerD